MRQSYLVGQTGRTPSFRDADEEQISVGFSSSSLSY